MGSSVTVTRGTAAAYAPPAPGMPVHSARTFGVNVRKMKRKSGCRLAEENENTQD
jgi:hypothetical protein